MHLHLILFLLFGGLAVVAGINLLVQRHPIYSALSLVAVMGSLAVLYLLLGAEFIAFIQVIVYAGAIMVLFIFVIMVLNAAGTEQRARSKAALLLGIPSFAVLLILLATLMLRQFHAAPGVYLGENVYSVRDIGHSLFSTYLLPFEVTSVLFLVGVVGAVVLATHKEQAKLSHLVMPTPAKELDMLPSSVEPDVVPSRHIAHKEVGA